jgi:hypothetical protein
MSHPHRTSEKDPCEEIGEAWDAAILRPAIDPANSAEKALDHP